MPSRLLRTLPIVITLLLIGCGGGSDKKPSDGIVVQPANDSGSKGTSTPILSTSGTPGVKATSGPGAGLTPRAGTPADLATAQRLEQEGDLQGASASYLAVAAQKQDATLATAMQGAARTLLDQDDATDVMLLLEPYLNGHNDAPSHYMLARAYSASQRYDQALQQYDLYISYGRAALPYAYLDRARVLLNMNRPVDAAASVALAQAQGLPSAQNRSFLLAAAQESESNGNLTEAIAGYTAILQTSSSSSDQAIALERIMSLKRLQGDPSWVDAQTRLLNSYPASDQALEELRSATARGDNIDDGVRGIIYYRHNNYDSAEPLLRGAFNAAPDAKSSAEVAYYLAAIDESHDKNQDAEDEYAKAYQLNPDSSIADDALWWRGRLLEGDNKLDDARQLFDTLVKQYPSSSWAPDAGFRRGLLPYEQGKYTDAASAWTDSLTKASDPTDKQRLQLWQGKALLKAGDKQNGSLALQALATTSPLDYYGQRAGAVLKDQNKEPKATKEAKIDLSPTFDWTAAELWLTQKTGKAANDTSWMNDRRWQRAQELWTVGRDSQALSEVSDLMDSSAKDPVVLYGVARALQAQGRTSMSARAGQRLLRALNTTPSQGLPKALLSLSYPAAFPALLQKRAQEAGISPLLMLAFIRQESFFDPRAQAPDGGLGLTQVQPETGASIAKTLGVNDYEDDELLQADNSLRFGASYMAEQLKTFDNEIFVAFGAYNAGPEAAKRWRKSAGDDPDLFLEAVEFAITRTYVQNVGENYAIYRYLYGGSSAPDWPNG